jgi:hypothetical protein
MKEKYNQNLSQEVSIHVRRMNKKEATVETQNHILNSSRIS